MQVISLLRDEAPQSIICGEAPRDRKRTKGLIWKEFKGNWGKGALDHIFYQICLRVAAFHLFQQVLTQSPGRGLHLSFVSAGKAPEIGLLKD